MLATFSAAGCRVEIGVEVMRVRSGQRYYICALAWARWIGGTQSGVTVAIVAHCAINHPPLRNVFPGRAGEMTSGSQTTGAVTVKL